MSTQQLEIHAPFGAKINTVRSRCAASFPAAALPHVPINACVTLPDDVALVILREGRDIVLSRIVDLKEGNDTGRESVNTGS